MARQANEMRQSGEQEHGARPYHAPACGGNLWAVQRSGLQTAFATITFRSCPRATSVALGLPVLRAAGVAPCEH
jgi:hypothetical protein